MNGRATMIVLDSNVFAKLLVSESDSALARQLVRAIQSEAVPVVLPSLFVYELVQVGRYHELDTQSVLDFMDTQLLRNWLVVEPTRDDWKVGQEISSRGNDRSGYPAMYDSIYHAIAIERQGCFITADRKHFSKAKDFGSIVLLPQWQRAVAQYGN